VNVSVQDDVHFLNAVNSSNQFDTNVVPVLSKAADFIGVITTSDLLKMLGNFPGQTK
jgi:predicted transcriptional regulator